jgi:hypothetical protein
MRRLLFALVLSIPALACRFDAPGRCSSSADCNGGLPCIQGICALCQTAADCSGWESCTASRACEPLAGRCNGDVNCSSWEQCDATHTCVMRPDHCPTMVTCTAWESCDAGHHCLLDAGRCNQDTDCAAWATCDAGNTCAVNSSNGGDIMIWGTLSEGACYRDALAPLNNPTRFEVGFDCSSGSGILSPTGQFLYKHFVSSAVGTQIKRFVPDRLVWQGAVPNFWEYPSDGNLNDPIVIAPTACPTTVLGFAVQAVTGGLMYGCATANWTADYHDSASADVPGLTGVRVNSWNYGDFKLVTTGSNLAVVDGSGGTKIVNGLPSGAKIAYRATATGFRVPIQLGVGSAELWAIANDGTATWEGTYAPEPAGFVLDYQGGVIDSAGNLYTQGMESATFTDVITRLPHDGSAATIVYTEADQPANANHWDSVDFNPFVLLHISYLYTSP